MSQKESWITSYADGLALYGTSDDKQSSDSKQAFLTIHWNGVGEEVKCDKPQNCVFYFPFQSNKKQSRTVMTCPVN